MTRRRRSTADPLRSRRRAARRAAGLLGDRLAGAAVSAVSAVVAVTTVVTVVALTALLGARVTPAGAAPAHAVSPGPPAVAHIDSTTDLRKGPLVLYQGDPSTMHIVWQTYLTAACTIEWGTDESYDLGLVGTTEYGDAHQHAHTIDDLAPATLYHYRVTVNGAPHTGSFISAPDPATTAVGLMIHGDTQSGAPVHDVVSEQMIAEYTADPALRALAIGLGDLSNFGATETDWDALFFRPDHVHIRERLANVPYVTAIGNHDIYETAYTYDIEGTHFKKYFPQPWVDDRYWSFDFGPVHVVVADLYPAYYDPGLPSDIWPGSISPEQAAWIEADLAATDRTWKLVAIHEGGWSAGPHPNNPAVQDTLHPLCVAYGVDMVFSGHNHYYARAVVDGVQYVTCGSAGANLYTPNPYSPNIVVTERTRHFVTIEVDGETLTYRALRADGTLIEQLILLPGTTGMAASPGGGPGGGASNPTLAAHASWPNPFNPRTTIGFDLAAPAHVTLRILDARGRSVRTLIDGTLTARRHRVDWDGRDAGGRAVASGVYWYRLETAGHVATRKLVLCR